MHPTKNKHQPPDTARRGGPRTAAGKARSRGNAVTHGLSVKHPLPAVLERGRVDYYRQRFQVEYQPMNATQRTLTDELARHAAAMELSESAESAVLRDSATKLTDIAIRGIDDAAGREDAVIAAAVTTKALDRFSRYRRMHERAFYAALDHLRELQAEQGTSPDALPVSDMSPPSLTSEEECELYLRQRLEAHGGPCPKCGDSKVTWLDTRQVQECDACGHQTSLRAGTVMERSKLPLLVWMQAIQHLLASPAATTAELSAATGVNRADTVRRVRAKVLAALKTDQAASLLAGLAAGPPTGLTTTE